MKNILYRLLPDKADARLIISMALIALVGFSCTSEIAEPGSVERLDFDREVQVSIRIPSNPVAPQSRAITDTEENYISSLYILSFRLGVDNSEKFDYWSEAKEKAGNINGVHLQSYTATLKVRDNRQRLVLLSNLSDGVRSLIEQGNWKDVDKDQMLASLEEIIGSNNSWNAASPADYRSLPMWGESTPQTIINTTSDLTGTIPLLRMVANVDVQLDESVPGLKDKFRLKSVRLYNTNTKGCVVPARNTIEDVTESGIRTVKAHTPTIPADIADYSQRHRGPVLYEDFSPPGEVDITIRGAIYLFEAASTTRHMEATCLVVGGIYGSDSEETFYRVDFVQDDRETLLHILRNHKYTVNIIDVRQSGYKDPEDAFRFKGENIKVTIIQWNEHEIDDMVFDGQYYYSVSPRNIEHNGGTSTGNTIRVKTDYPEWSYELSDRSQPEDPMADPTNVDWLEVTSHTAGDNIFSDGTAQYILYNVTSNHGEERTAYIHVTAGRVTMTAAIHQTNTDIKGFIVEPSGTIPFFGEMRTVKAFGIFQSIQIRARDIHTNEILDNNTINYGLQDNSALLSIPQFVPLQDSPATRVIAFEYYDITSADWQIIRTDDQRGERFNINVDHANGQPIRGIGTVSDVRILGEFPTIYLRASTDLGIIWESEPIPAGSTDVFTQGGSITIPINASQMERMVYFQYSTNRIKWNTMSSGIQLSEHFILSTGRIVALDDLPAVLNWPQAMGINSSFLSSHFYRTYGGEIENFGYTPDPAVSTGCAGYFESHNRSDIGTWRLPTFDELAEIEEHRYMIGNFADNRYYWTSREVITSVSRAYQHSVTPQTSTANQVKSFQLYVRCVRAVD